MEGTIFNTKNNKYLNLYLFIINQLENGKSGNFYLCNQFSYDHLVRPSFKCQVYA